jgi:Tfp pilus assembly protein PilX
MKHKQDGFILMIVCLVLLVVAIAGLAFWRVQLAAQ